MLSPKLQCTRCGKDLHDRSYFYKATVTYHIVSGPSGHVRMFDVPPNDYALCPPCYVATLLYPEPARSELGVWLQQGGDESDTAGEREHAPES